MKYNTSDNKLIYESIFDRQGHNNYKKPVVDNPFKVNIPTVSYRLGENREAIYYLKLVLADNAHPWMMHKNHYGDGYIITLRMSDRWSYPENKEDTEEMLSATHDPEWTLASSDAPEGKKPVSEKDLDPLYNFGLPFDADENTDLSNTPRRD